MNCFERLLYLLQGEMNTPQVFGLYHCFWLILSLIVITILYNKENKYSERKLKLVLGVYSIIALIFEILKQLIWTFNYDPVTNIVTWDYQWYAAPFQLCTTPMIVSIICFFLNITILICIFIIIIPIITC